VFTTVHANSVFDVVSRFVHMGVDIHGFVGALNGILAQRLLRMTCEHCSEAVAPSREEVAASGLALADVDGWTLREGRGCGHCRGTGYRGRRAIGEVLVLNDDLREAIVARAPVRRLRELALEAGVRLLRASALDLVATGHTTLTEANRVTALA
jgi:general secretion pathway protein E